MLTATCSAFGLGINGSMPVNAQQEAGTKRWSFDINQGVRSSPTVINQTAFIGGLDGHVYALNANDGTEEWRYNTGDSVFSSPMVVDNKLYIGSYSGYLHAIDITSGSEEWRFDTGDGIQASSPTYYNNVLYFGDVNSNVYAVDATSGTQRWEFATEDRVDSSPIVTDEAVYIASRDGNLYSISRTGGEEIWRFESNDEILDAAPALDDGVIYIGSEDENLYAINQQTGEEVWRFRGKPYGFIDSPTVSNGDIIVGDASGTVYSLSPDGEERWRFVTEDLINSGPTVAENNVYIGSRDGSLYAISADEGSLEWNISLGEEIQSSPTVVDGIVYVGSQPEGLHAINSGHSGSSSDSRVTMGALGHHDSFSANNRGGATMFQQVSHPADSPLFWSLIVTGSVGGCYLGYKKFYQSQDQTKTASTNLEDTSTGINRKDGGLTGISGVGDAKAEQLREAGYETVDHVRGASQEELADVDEIGTPLATQIKTDVGSIETGEDIEAEDHETAGRETTALPGSQSSGRGAQDAIENLLEDVAVTLDSANQSRDSGAYDRALARCREAIETAKEARDAAREGAPDRVPDAEAVFDDATALQEAIRGERNARQQAMNVLNQVEDALDDAAGMLENKNLEDAFSRLDDAKAEFGDAGNAVENHDFPDLVERSKRLANHHEELRNRAETLRDAHRRATDALDTGEDALDDAAAALEGGTTQEVLSSLDGVEETLDTAKEPIDDHGFLALADRLDALEQRHERLRQDAEDAVTRMPKTIPTTPRYTLSYDDIEKGDPVGRGGNADVYYATAATDNGSVELALKEPRMSGTLHVETVERLLKEAKTWQQLDDHDHIVTVTDYGSDPLPWIAMEYMHAGHLGERAGNLEFEQALWTAIATTKAVRHAHRRGVAHLDLKPQNVLFRSVDDAWDVPKVADWGLSKQLLQHSKSVEGMSPHYAAPEQLSEEFGSTDDITDIYQLGAVFYELFTGRPPFEGHTFEVINKIQTETPIPPTQLVDVPPALDDILMSALATKKADRYESVIYLRDDLQKIFDSK